MGRKRNVRERKRVAGPSRFPTAKDAQANLPPQNGGEPDVPNSVAVAGRAPRPACGPQGSERRHWAVDRRTAVGPIRGLGARRSALWRTSVSRVPVVRPDHPDRGFAPHPAPCTGRKDAFRRTWIPARLADLRRRGGSRPFLPRLRSAARQNPPRTLSAPSGRGSVRAEVFAFAVPW
jgi:hypothetical protein